MEDDADSISPEKGEAAVVHLRDVLPTDGYLPLVGRIQSCNDVDQSGFSAAAFPGDSNKFSPRNDQIEMVQSYDGNMSLAINLRHVGKYNKVIFHPNKKSRDPVFPALFILMGGKVNCQYENKFFILLYGRASAYLL